MDVTWAYTRAAPPGWDGRVGRLDAAAIAEAVWPPDRMPAIYVCGPTGFVEHVADTLIGARPRRRQHQDRTIRRCVMRAENATWVVDGNAAAGILSEVFTGDVTACSRDVRRMRLGRAARRGGRRARRDRGDRSVPRLHAHAGDGPRDPTGRACVVGDARGRSRGLLVSPAGE